MKYLKLLENFETSKDLKKITPEHEDPNKSNRGLETEPSNESETSKYRPPNNAVKVPDNDTGFELVKKHYNRMIWTWNKYNKNKAKKDITNESLNQEEFPNKIMGNDEIVWVKGEEKGGVVNYTPYYKGHNIDFGGYNFRTRKEMDKYIENYILSNQWYNKLRNAKEKPLPNEAP